MKKKILIMIAVMIFPLLFLSQRASAQVTDEYDGYDFTDVQDAWTYDSSTGTLTILDESAMESCSSQGLEQWEIFNVHTPWKSYRDEVKKVVIKDGVKTIGACAFTNFVNLTSVSIPDSVTTIEKYAFYGCSSLKTITIPKGVTTIEEMPFYKCAALQKITVSSGNTKFVSKDGVLFNKAMTKLICYPRNKAGKSYTIPSTVKTIDLVAFYGQKNLTSVTITKNVVTIDAGAFQQCTKLKTVTFQKGSSLKYIKERYDWYDEGTAEHFIAFGYCTSLQSFAIPNSTVSVGSYTFKGCESLKKVSIGKSLKTIANDRDYTSNDFLNFKGCTSLQKITISSSNKYFKSVKGVVYSKNGKTLYVYPAAKKGTSFTIPSSVTKVNEVAFRANKNLKKITIGKNVTKIEAKAFYACEKLTTVKFNSKLTTIGDRAFQKCKKITSITIPNKVKTIGDSAFRSCTALKTVKLGKKVSSIGDSAFRSCKKLKSVTLNSGLKKVQSFAFYGCSSLKSVKVPKTVKTIETGAFGQYYKEYSNGKSSNKNYKGFVLYGYKSSAAYKYAKSQGITFKSL